MSPVLLTIPQPCHENWAAMTPTAAGRHCAACAKTVVDFTLQTDAEILAFLAGAADGRTCGRFAAGQLERPLQRAVPAAPTGRWRAWLAAAVAVWSLREAAGLTTTAQAPAEWRALYWGGPVPATPPTDTKETPAPAGSGPATTGRPIIASPVPVQPHLLTAPARVLKGIVTDFSNKEVLQGVTVLVKGTTIGASTDANGFFEIVLPKELASLSVVEIQASFIGYVTQQRFVQVDAANVQQVFQLQADVKGFMGEVIIVPYCTARPPAPWHARRFYHWSKYWVTRPFRRTGY